VPRGGKSCAEARLALGGELQAPAFQVFAEDVLFPGSHAIATQSQLQYSPRPRRCQPGLDLRSAQREGGPREDRPAAMWQGFTIALREGIESFLIVALT